MCGIAGIVSQERIEEQVGRRLLSCLSHRGPDDEGIHLEPDRNLLLAHTRLSILDLSEAGHQPMTNTGCPQRGGGDSPLWVTYNGEIYNTPELRKELIAKGHRFASRTDTEVLLHLYEEEGEELVHRLIGMFAFAIYDRPRRRLLLVRDRLGIKPLYFAEHAGKFLFASEIKAILAAEMVPVEVDWQAIRDYFTFLFVPHPQTAFQGIRQLPPATWGIYDLSARRLTLRRYWTPWGPGAGPGGSSSPQALRDRLRETLTDAVRGEMLSDVPLGVFFSGGIDSTLLAALMGRCGEQKVRTFTVGFRWPGKDPRDDLPYARLAGRELGTDHHELIVELTAMEEMLDLVRHFDQPFANPTFYLQYLVARQTREFVTVALSGVGADELFGGYPKYHLFPWAAFLSRLPSQPAQGLRRLLGGMQEDACGPLIRRGKRLLKGVGHPLAEQYVRWSYYLTEEEKDQLLTGPLALKSLLPASRMVREAFESLPEGTGLYDRILYAEMQTFLAGNLLEYTDKMTMAVALETRVPFLDHRLVELSTQISFRDKIRWGQSKVILLDTFRDLIPPAIAQAPKRGFSPPIAQWMTAVLDRYFDQVLTKKRVEADGIFRWDGIQRLRLQHQRRLRDASMELLGIILFDVWFRSYILKDRL